MEETRDPAKMLGDPHRNKRSLLNQLNFLVGSTSKEPLFTHPSRKSSTRSCYLRGPHLAQAKESWGELVAHKAPRVGVNVLLVIVFTLCKSAKTALGQHSFLTIPLGKLVVYSSASVAKLCSLSVP